MRGKAEQDLGRIANLSLAAEIPMLRIALLSSGSLRRILIGYSAPLKDDTLACVGGAWFSKSYKKGSLSIVGVKKI